MRPLAVREACGRLSIGGGSSGTPALTLWAASLEDDSNSFPTVSNDDSLWCVLYHFRRVGVLGLLEGRLDGADVLPSDEGASFFSSSFRVSCCC